MTNSNLENYLKSCGFPKRFLQKEWSDYVAKDKAALAQVKGYAARYQEHSQEGLGLFIHGLNGSGKTLLALLAIKEICKEGGVRVEIIDFDALCRTFSDGYQDQERREEMLQRITKSSLLLIDKVPGTATQNIAVKAITSVLTPRLNNLRPTILTSTYKPGDITGALSGDIASMLREMCKIVHVKNEDYRIKLADDRR